MSHKKIGPDRFIRFDVYWIQKKQTDKPNLYIDCTLFTKIIFVKLLRKLRNVKIKKFLRRNFDPTDAHPKLNQAHFLELLLKTINQYKDGIGIHIKFCTL